MGKKGRAKNFPKSEPGSGSHTPISLREEATGKIQTRPASNTKSNLRIEHLKKLAVWATNHPLIPSLGAFYGQHLATLAEAAGIPPDPSLITCQRFAYSFLFLYIVFFHGFCCHNGLVYNLITCSAYLPYIYHNFIIMLKLASMCICRSIWCYSVNSVI